MRRRQRLAVAALLLLLALAVLVLLLRPAVFRGAASGSPETQATGAVPGARARPRPGSPPDGGLPAEATVSLPPAEVPIIDEIVVEKASVCEREENLVTVRAHTPSGHDDPFLRYFVNGVEGPRVPVSLAMNYTSNFELSVLVYGREGRAARGTVPAYEVGACWQEDVLQVRWRALPAAPDRIELEAQHDFLSGPRPASQGDVPPTVSDFQPVRYRWDFGDGTSQETATPVVVHDYARRPGRSSISYFLVACEAIDRRGEALLGRASVRLHNPDFRDARLHGVVRLRADEQEAVPVAGGTQHVVRLWHRHAEPVTVTGMTRRRVRRAEVTEATERRPAPREEAQPVEPRSVLGTDTIAPEGVEVRLTLPTGADDPVVAEEYALVGRAPGGLRVEGVIVVSRPDLPPLHRRMLTDAVLRARVLRARDILERADVTEEEVFKLSVDMEGVYEAAPDPDDMPPPPPRPRR